MNKPTVEFWDGGRFEYDEMIEPQQGVTGQDQLWLAEDGVGGRVTQFVSAQRSEVLKVVLDRRGTAEFWEKYEDFFVLPSVVAEGLQLAEDHWRANNDKCEGLQLPEFWGVEVVKVDGKNHLGCWQKYYDVVWVQKEYNRWLSLPLEIDSAEVLHTTCGRSIVADWDGFIDAVRGKMMRKKEGESEDPRERVLAAIRAKLVEE